MHFVADARLYLARPRALPLADRIPVACRRDSRFPLRALCSYSEKDGSRSCSDWPVYTSRTVWRRAP
jgi:hypothetical protein